MRLTPAMTALVTGAGSGIGAATALAFARRGLHVICVDLDEGAAEATAALAGGLSEHGASAARCDVGDRLEVDALAARTTAEHGPLDVLVNDAGVGMSGRFLDVGPDDWTWLLRVNLHGVVHGCRAFGRPMVEAGRGQVVNVASGLGYVPTATLPAYCTSKAAVLQLSRCLRADWRRHGVGVTAICPGIIDTPIARRTRIVGGHADARDRMMKVFKHGHRPEAVASAIVRSVEHDRGVVPVGWESWGAYAASRLLPSRAFELSGRLGLP